MKKFRIVLITNIDKYHLEEKFLFFWLRTKVLDCNSKSMEFIPTVTKWFDSFDEANNFIISNNGQYIELVIR
jgi:hypothetical protein